MLYSLIALMRLVRFKWLIRSGGGTEHTQTHPKRANTDHTTPAMINPVFTPPWEINACLKPNKIPVSPELIFNARLCRERRVGQRVPLVWSHQMTKAVPTEPKPVKGERMAAQNRAGSSY